MIPLIRARSQVLRLFTTPTAEGDIFKYNASTGKMDIVAGVQDVLVASLAISSAQILALNTTPLDLVAAPGAGKIILPLQAIANYTFLTGAYTTNLTLQLLQDTGTQPLMTNDNVLGHSASNIGLFEPNATALTQIVANKKLQVKVATGDPAAGSGSLKIQLAYIVLTLS